MRPPASVALRAPPSERAPVSHSPPTVPADLRRRLECARLDNLALMRALDRTPGVPSRLPPRLVRQLGEHDADCAEALWALDQPASRIDVRAVVRDTLRSLASLPQVREDLRGSVGPESRASVRELELVLRESLDPTEAYSQVPGRPSAPVKARPATASPRVGRNELCPCGSGKKSKRCCAGAAGAAGNAAPRIAMTSGCYEGADGFFPSISGVLAGGRPGDDSFVMVKWAESHDAADAAEESARDLRVASAGGRGLVDATAWLLRAGYVRLDDPDTEAD
jgi:hypothetical protein